MLNGLMTTIVVVCCCGFLSMWAPSPEDQMLAAAASGDLQKVTKLLNESSDLAIAEDKVGRSAVQLATANLHVDVVEKLLLSGARVPSARMNGATLLHVALRSRDKASDDADKRLKLVKLLIKFGVDVRTHDMLGKTALHFAAMNGHYNVLEPLLKEGADLMARDQWQQTPLHDAALNNQIPMIDWLVSHGVPVNVAEMRKEIPLHSAVRRFRLEATERLLTLGSPVDSRNAFGQTPLHLTGIAGPEEPEVDKLMTPIAEKLIEAGADVNATDNKGNTPLHYALSKHRTKLAALLRDKGGKSIAPEGK